MSRLRAAARAITLALACQTAVNALLLRRPSAADVSQERISVLLPLRDEAERAAACLQSLTNQDGLPGASVEILVLDDASRDGTAALVKSVADRTPGMRLIRGAGEPPPGFVGKPWACARLAAAASQDATVLIFLDADVVFAPHGLAETVALLRSARLDFVSPYPRQLAATTAERLVQPLLQWSWLTFVPLRLAERAPYPSLAMANGQLLAVDAERYRKAGGHAAAGVRDAVLDDLALARSLRRQGCAGGMADGTAIATCRMYEGWAQLRDGYSKSLWAAAGGSPPRSVGQLLLLGWLYLWPDPVCYLAGVVSRVIAARRTGSRSWPDALVHPLSVAAFGVLSARSWRGKASGTLTWKDRPVVPAFA
jgi:hypothetical protein